VRAEAVLKGSGRRERRQKKRCAGMEWRTGQPVPVVVIGAGSAAGCALGSALGSAAGGGLPGLAEVREDTLGVHGAAPRLI
jgi:hypothetical protein